MEIDEPVDKFMKDLRDAILEIKREHDLLEVPIHNRTLHIATKQPTLMRERILGYCCGYKLTIGGDMSLIKPEVGDTVLISAAAIGGRNDATRYEAHVLDVGQSSYRVQLVDPVSVRWIASYAITDVIRMRVT